MGSITYMKIYRGTFRGKSRIMMAVDRVGQKNTRRRPLYKNKGRLSYDYIANDRIWIDRDEIDLLRKLSGKFLCKNLSENSVSWPIIKPKKNESRGSNGYSDILDEIHETKINQGAWENATNHSRVGACKVPSKEDYALSPQILK